MIRATLVRWTARLLVTRVTECIDWDVVDPAERFDDDRLAEALDWDDLDPADRFTDEQLADAIDFDALDLEDYVNPDVYWGDPVERLHQLEDDPERGYVWLVESEAAARQWSELIEREWLAEYGRQPEAAHFVISDLEELREFDADAVRMVDPGGVA